VQEPSPDLDRAYKHSEDLIDALLCPWTASLWHPAGLGQYQVLAVAASATTGDSLVATIIAPTWARTGPSTSLDGMHHPRSAVRPHQHPTPSEAPCR